MENQNLNFIAFPVSKDQVDQMRVIIDGMKASWNRKKERTLAQRLHINELNRKYRKPKKQQHDTN